MSCLDFIALDVETTGLDEKRHEITESGIVRFRNGELVAEYSTLVKPTEMISDFVANMTGITNEMVSQAPVFEAVVDEMLEFIGNDLVVGHNIKFDIGMLDQALIRVNKPVLDNVMLDTLDIISILNPTGGSFKLSHLAKIYGVLEENVHRAKDDSMMTANLYLKLVEEIKTLDKNVVSVLLYYLDQTDIPLRMIFDDVFGNKLEKHDYPWVSFKFNKLKIGEISERYKDDSFKDKDIDSLFQMFKEDGSLAKNLPGFEVRSAQVDMMEKVWQSFEKNIHLVVEAGTGTGKSLAYLLPAVYFSLKQDKTVVISTKTKALQEQLIDIDIPTLKKALGIEFKEEMIKGKENYICLNTLAYLMNSAVSR
ncbi:MAG: exonuclease domain-containing protein, partial [Candidatus Riflemargulisbacteria bacterium]